MPSISPKQVYQGNTSRLRSVEGPQLELLSAGRASSPVDSAYLLTLPSLRRAIRYSISLADLEPKEVFEPLEIDKASWSRIENGSMEFPAGKLNRLRLVVGNDAVHRWLAHEAGFDLRPLKSALQEQLDLERAENARLRQENETIKNFVRETQGRR